MNEIIKKNGITYGLILGVFSILVTTIAYAVDIKLFLSGWITFLKVAVFFTVMIVLLSKTKKELSGIYTFKQAFTTYFIAALVGLLLATVFEIILFNLIDPSLKDSIKEMSLDFSVNLMEKLGAPQSEINKAIEKIQETDQFSIGQLLQGTVMYLLFASVPGLILAAIFKTKSPNND
ncbi:MAG: DUF4199 domain-containing protein [Bacteroidota bacterium]